MKPSAVLMRAQEQLSGFAWGYYMLMAVARSDGDYLQARTYLDAGYDAIGAGRDRDFIPADADQRNQAFAIAISAALSDEAVTE